MGNRLKAFTKLLPIMPHFWFTSKFLLQNSIGEALAKRIVRASRGNEQFKIYIVIPCVPGMNGKLEENNAQAQEVIIHLTMESINRGKSSIKE